MIHSKRINVILYFWITNFSTLTSIKNNQVLNMCTYYYRTYTRLGGGVRVVINRWGGGGCI